MILTFLNSVLKDIIWKNFFYLLALVIYYLQKRDAMHEFKSEIFFYIYVFFLLKKLLTHVLKGSQHVYKKVPNCLALTTVTVGEFC